MTKDKKDDQDADVERDEEETSTAEDERADDADDEDADDEDADDEDADDEDADDEDADDEDADDEDEDDEDADDEDADEDEDEDEDEPSKDAAPPAKSKKTSSHGGASRARRPRRAPPKKKGSPTRNVIIFVALVGGLAAAFGLLGSQSSGTGPAPQPKWKVGETVDVEITLVTTDHKDLGCALAEDIAGKHCAFETQNKRNAKSSDSRKDANLLQPYTTTNNMHLLGAGLWMTPALKTKLDKENWDRPSPRFAVKCKFAVEGIAKDVQVQWKPGEGWHRESNWHTGAVSDCTITTP